MTTNMKNTIAKVARVLLVFLLVFWGSFRAEAVAYAALSSPKGIDVEDVDSKDQLTDLVVYEVDPAPATDNTTGLGKKLASASDKGEIVLALEFAAPGEACELVAIPAWNGKNASIDKETGKIEIANFVKWGVIGEGLATIEPSEKTPGIATLTSVAAGTVTVTCELSKKAQEELDLTEFPVVEGGLASVAFKAKIAEPVKPDEPVEPTEPEEPVEPVVEVSKRVSELKVSDEDGSLVSGTGVPKVLPKSQVGKPYSFKTEIKVSVLTGEEESFEAYNTLAAAREAGIEVTWSLTAGADIAEISQNGELTFSEEGSVSVHVEAAVDGAMTPADFVVKTEGSAEPEPSDEPTPGDEPGSEPQPVSQGETNPQDTLTVVSNGLVVPSAEDEEHAGEDDESASSSSSSSEGDTQSEGEEDSDSTNTSSSSTAAEEEDQKAQTIEKTYSVSDLEALGTGRATYTMYDGSEFVTVTGEGPYLVGLLRDIGIENTDQVESLTFENADGIATTITWSELESANRYYPKAAEGNFEDAESVSPIIAINSLVRGLGDGTREGADAESAEGDGGNEESGSASSASSASNSSSSSGSESTSSSDSSTVSSSSSSSSASSSAASVDSQALSDAPISSDVDLLDNTRFRLLFGSTSPARAIASPDALRYINKITVNLKPNAEEEDEGFNTDINVSVEYVPVPIGAPAVFSALPNTAIRDARFDFNWEVSTDDGKTWKPVENGNVQVLRVITTEERLGNKYRVVMSTDAADKDGRENVIVTSDPVTMTEGNGLAVVLEYDPPIAGQTAYFQTTLYGTKSGVDIKYTWQQSQDGGATWTDIAGRTGSSLAVPTEPVDPNAEKADDDEVVPITYVRVIAEETSGDKRVAISEAVPLTVHIGDDDSGSADTPNPDGSNEDKPSTTPEQPTTPSKPKPRVTPVENIDIEDPIIEDAKPTVPTPEGTLTQQVDPSQLYINDAVTEKVNEQQEAVEEYVESTVPGARWTSLSHAQATGDDVRNILADNPFAPFVFPVGLGVTVAGGVEKLFAFRRQVK